MNNNKIVNLYGFSVNKERKKLAEAASKSETKIGELLKLADLARISLVAVF